MIDNDSQLKDTKAVVLQTHGYCSKSDMIHVPMTTVQHLSSIRFKSLSHVFCDEQPAIQLHNRKLLCLPETVCHLCYSFVMSLPLFCSTPVGKKEAAHSRFFVTALKEFFT